MKSNDCCVPDRPKLGYPGTLLKQGLQSTTSILWLMLIWVILPVHSLVVNQTTSYSYGPTCAGNISSTEYAALQGLYSSTGGPNWLWDSSLNRSTQQWVFPSRLSAPCEDHWEGISCGIQSHEHGDTCFIASLVLPLTNLRGRLPSCLGSLSRLATLDLNHNALTGSIPSQLGGLSLLTSLNLGFNSLVGWIPSQVGNLTSLVSLDLAVNRLRGTIPSLLGVLGTLKQLDLSGNFLNGSIPSQLGGLNSLETLDLSRNTLMGLIPPQLGGLGSLSVMSLYFNSLTGSIPTQLGGLGSLKSLNLGYNSLIGSIPLQVGNLTSLARLDMAVNRLTGSIPSVLGGMDSLQQLDLFGNFLTGFIPSQLGELNTIETLDLSVNKLEGSIPPELGGLGSLAVLSLYVNSLTGSIPTQLGRLGSLTLLDFSMNSLTGPIPSELGGLHSLVLLRLNLNSLAGTIPSELGEELGFLEQLDFGVNSSTGSIPSQLGSVGSLVVLTLNNNLLTGSIPSQLGGLANLTQLYLNSNSLTGPIPTALGGLGELKALELERNRLTGPIPSQLGGLGSLVLLYVDNCKLTGSIPPELGSLGELVAMSMVYNFLTGSMPTALGSLSSLTVLNLFKNLLTGRIPSEMGTLDELIVFDVNSNSLVGSIPFQLGGLTSLSQLALSSNLLTGSIPTQLENLSLVTQLALDDNSLTGTIPSELATLEYMQELNLAGNRLVGGIPGAVGGLLQCYLLNLSSNALTGTVPSSLGSLGSKLVIYNISKGKPVTLDLSQNLFKGTIPAALFSKKMQTAMLHGNCFQGSLPEEICSATLLQTLVLDKLTSGEGCDLNLFGFKASFTRKLLDGSIPGCVWSMPLLQTLHVSGNGLQGTLGEIQQPSQLSILDASNNFFTGSIPKSLQTHPGLQQLLLRGNKLSGTLEPSFAVANMTNLGLAVNRLSGDIPASFYASSSLQLNVLSGNIFYCVGGNLPANDPSSNGYVCGSDALNDALIAWGSCVGMVVLFLLSLFVMRSCGVEAGRCLQSIYDTNAAWWLGCSDAMARNASLGDVMTGIERGRNSLCCWAILIVTICLSIYGTIKSVGKVGTVTEQYAWVTSAAFMHGATAATVVSLCVSMSVIAATIVIERIDMNSKMTIASSESAGRLSWKNVTQRLALQLISIVVLFVVNVAYVYLVIVSDLISATSLLAVQAAVGLFKLAWRQLYINGVIEWMRRNHTDLTSHGLVYHDLLMSLLMFIVLPCLATLGTDSRCLYEVEVGEDAIPSSFNVTSFLTFCAIKTSTSGQTHEQCLSSPFKQELTISITPPWLYSYQCTSALLKNYVPVLLLTYTASGILVPLVQYGALFVPEEHWVELTARMHGLLGRCSFPSRGLGLLNQPNQPSKTQQEKRDMKTSARLEIKHPSGPQDDDCGSVELTSPMPSTEEPSANGLDDSVGAMGSHCSTSHAHSAPADVATLTVAVDQEAIQTSQHERKTLIDEERLKVTLLLDLAVLLTYGLAAPLLALAIVFKQITTALYLRLMIGRFLPNAVGGKSLELVKRCGQVNAATVAILFLVINGFWSAMVFDMVADVYGDGSGGVASLVVFLGWAALVCACRWVALKRRTRQQPSGSEVESPPALGGAGSDTATVKCSVSNVVAIDEVYSDMYASEVMDTNPQQQHELRL